MTLLCDFTFYCEAYLGKLSEKDFDRYAPRAQAFLDFATQGRIKKKNAVSPRDQLALCAVTDACAKWEQTGGIHAESAGGYAVTYQDSPRIQVLYDAAAIYLEDGLLFRGVLPC